MSETLSLLHAPLGGPGSGRVRYGAAMALYRRGLLGEDALEVYRICSPLDAQAAAPLLLERGLHPPAWPGSDTASRVARLLREADSYLSALTGPGVIDARLGLARAVASHPPTGGARNPIVERHLAPALSALAPTHPGLAAAIAAAAPDLGWITYDEYPADEIGAAFAHGHAFASLVGAGAPYWSGDFDFGLFLIAPHVLYRDHAHAASELYVPLTGPHGWRFSPGAPLALKPAHEPVWNEPGQPHLTKVGALPFLCLYCWTHDAEARAHVVRASDWPELEALRL